MLHRCCRPRHHDKNLTFAHINIRSLRHKVHEVCVLLHKYDISILAVSETWLDISDDVGSVDISGYCLFRRDREHKIGGGVCIYVKFNLTAHEIAFHTNPDIELLWVRILSSNVGRGLLVGCIYRPPSSGVEYWQKLGATLEGAENEEMVLLGDLNVDFLKKSTAPYHHLQDAVLLPLNLNNVINSATRFTSHGSSSLDVVLSNTDSIHSGEVIDTEISDHALVMAKYRRATTQPPSRRCQRMRRDLRHLDVDRFANLLCSAGLSEFSHDDADGMWQEWQTKFTQALDKAAPLQSVAVSNKRCSFYE